MLDKSKSTEVIQLLRETFGTLFNDNSWVSSQEWSRKWINMIKGGMCAYAKCFAAIQYLCNLKKTLAALNCCYCDQVTAERSP